MDSLTHLFGNGDGALISHVSLPFLDCPLDSAWIHRVEVLPYAVETLQWSLRH